METMHLRGTLSRFRTAVSGGKVKIGFAGGSITTAASPHNWPGYVRGWFLNKYPGVRLTMVNSAIGATGSMTGLALSKREFIDRGCDLVFIEYAVNDLDTDRTERMRTREGLIRRLLAEGMDVVLVYTYSQPMYKDIAAGKLPESVADLEVLAERYNLSSVFMALEAYEQVEKGILPWNAWLPDGLHPQWLGSYFYASAVIAYLEAELERTDVSPLPAGEALPEPVDALHWQDARLVDFDDIELTGSWCVAREAHIPWFPERLFTYGHGDSLKLTFEGRALTIIFAYGKTSGLFEYRMDGGEWQKYLCERYWWMPEDNYVNAVKFADDLAEGTHTFELRVTHGDGEGCNACDCKILSVMAV